MLLKNNFCKAAVIGVLCMAFIAQPAQAYAWWRGGYGWHGGWGWHHGWDWGWPVFGAFALGAAATAVWISGHPYYYYNGVYYDNTPAGYVVVNPPVATTVVAAPQTVVTAAQAPAPQVTVPQAGEDVVTVNVPNDNGGYTAVVLKRSGNGFVGPQGEFYPSFPKVSQLKLMYGK